MTHLDFIEIGTSDFDTIIQKCPEDSVGFTIEPIEYYLNKLPNKPNVTKIQALISNEVGVDVIHYIDPEDIKKFNLPWEVKGMNTIGNPHPGYEVFNIPQIKQYNIEIKKTTLPKTTLFNLLKSKNITSVGYLKIDTEGHDCYILNQFLDDIIHHKEFNLLPNSILFESNQWTNDELLTKTKQYFSNYYISAFEGHDTIFVKIKSNNF